LIETVTNAMSIHQLKKDYGISLSEYFARIAGGSSTYKYKTYQSNFINSVAAYSLVTYILQIKDRHNGNILIGNEGHIVHIDFGFMISNSPGGLNFETSPFKLPPEYIEFMGGVSGPMFQYFRACIGAGFTEIRKHSDKILELVDMLIQTKANMPCLHAGNIIEPMRSRFFLGRTSKECEEHLDELINISLNNSRTLQYDQFQYLSNGILH